jgi:hypothetical protein
MPPLALDDSRLTTPLTKANTLAPWGAITSVPWWLRPPERGAPQLSTYE